jgi:hypothetical protein
MNSEKLLFKIFFLITEKSHENSLIFSYSRNHLIIFPLNNSPLLLLNYSRDISNKYSSADYLIYLFAINDLLFTQKHSLFPFK